MTPNLTTGMYDLIPVAKTDDFACINTDALIVLSASAFAVLLDDNCIFVVIVLSGIDVNVTLLLAFVVAVKFAFLEASAVTVVFPLALTTAVGLPAFWPSANNETELLKFALTTWTNE